MLNINELTTQLRMLPDAILQRVAQMYKQDPYIFPMVISEGMARKKMRMASQARAASPQPKVNDQAVASLGYTPEEVGIAALPAPNMQNMADGGIAGVDDAEGYAGGGEVMMPPGATPSYQRTAMSPGMLDFAQRSEPVVRMSGGGVAHFRDGGKGGDDKTKFIEQYRDLAERVGSETGIDPALILSQWGLESAWGTKTVGSFNFGNIKDVTGKGPKAEDKAEGSTDAYKTYKSPEDFASDYTNLLKRNFPKALGTGSDVSKFTEGLTKGRVGAYATDPGYAMKVGRVYGDLKETLPDRVPADAGTTAAPVAAGTAATGVAGLMGGMGIKELLGATFKPGTTAGQAAGRILTGAGAVPAAVLGGGAAATKSAAETMGGMAPEQRAQFYQNPMIGAMSPDDAFAAAIMNAAQDQPIKPPARSMPYGEQMANVGKALVKGPGKAIAAIPGAVVDTVAGAKDYSTGQGAWLGGEEGLPPLPPAVDPNDPRLKNLAKDLKKDAPPEVKETAKKEGWSQNQWLALAAGLLSTPGPFQKALGQGIAGVLQVGQAEEKAAREQAEAESTAAYRKALAGKAAQETEELKAGRSANALRQKAVALAAQDLEKLPAYERMNMNSEQQQKWLNDRAMQYMQLIGVQPADTMGATGGGFKVLGVRPGT